MMGTLTDQMKKRPKRPKTKNPHLYEVGVKAPTRPLTTKNQEKKRTRRIWGVAMEVKARRERRIKGALINHCIYLTHWSGE